MYAGVPYASVPYAGSIIVEALTFFENKYAIEDGMKTITAAGIGGVLIED